MTCLTEIPTQRLPRVRAMFRAGWLDAIFIHFRVDAASLSRDVPLPLDRFDGHGYVSLVAFTQSRLRPIVGGRLTEWLSRPLARHEFLNVRTYVVGPDGTRGIFFLSEWISNRLAAFIGPRTYGLPYRVGRLRYDGFAREVIAGDDARLAFRATAPAEQLSRCAPATLDAFLLERYTAYTHRRGVTRRFDVAHDPWPQTRVDVELLDTSLLPHSGPWWRGASFECAHYSPGCTDVTMSGPSPCTRGKAGVRATPQQSSSCAGKSPPRSPSTPPPA